MVADWEGKRRSLMESERRSLGSVPMVGKVSIDTTLERAKQVLHAVRTGWVIDDGEDAFMQRLAKSACTLSWICLRRTNENERGRLLEPSKKLQHASATSNGPRHTVCNGRRARLVHRNAEVNDGDMHGRGANETRNLVSRARSETVNAPRRENRRQHRRKRIFPPTTVRQQQVQPPSRCMGMIRLMSLPIREHGVGVRREVRTHEKVVKGRWWRAQGRNPCAYGNSAPHTARSI